MRKAKAVPAPLKAKSLSDLRDLQRQIASQAKANKGAQAAPDHNRSSPDDPSWQPAAEKRRPHRFLPPSSGAIKPHPPPSQQLMTPASASGERQDTLNPEDVALFRRVVQSVTPAAQSNRAVLPPVPAGNPTQMRERRQHAAGQHSQGSLDVSDHYAPAGIDHDDTVFLQAGHGPHLIKGLKKGKWQIQANLDLHGANLDEARERMDRFIQSCREHQIRCVRIVHGKGYGSKNGDPVLKETVRRWLSQLVVVQAYVECDEADGGAGAVLVLLTKQKA